MAELTGIPTEPFFRSTASVRHHELSDLARDETALRDRLQASISGADRGTGLAKKKLERALHGLTTKGDKNPGHLKVAEEAVASSAMSVEQGELALAKLEQDRDALSGARERRADAGPGPGRTPRACSRRPARPSGSPRNGSPPRSATTGSGRRSKSPPSSTRWRQTHPSPNPLPVIRQSVERLRSLDAKIRELTAALSGEVAVQFDVAPEPTWRPLSRWGILLVLARPPRGWSARSLAATLGIIDLGEAPLYLGAAAAGIGLILTLIAFWLRRGSQMQEQLRDVEIDRRLRGRSEMEAELKQAQADTVKQLGALGLDDLAAAEDMLAKEEAHVARMDQLTAQLDGLVGKEPRETLGGLRDAAAHEVDQKTSALEHLGPIAKEPRARERLEVEVRDQEAAAGARP